MKRILLSSIIFSFFVLPSYAKDSKLLEFKNDSLYIYSAKEVATKKKTNRIPLKIIRQNQCINFSGEAYPDVNDSNIDSNMDLKLCLLDKFGNVSGNLTIHWKEEYTVVPQKSNLKGKFYENGKFYLYEVPKIKGNGVYKNIKYDFFDGVYKGTYYYYYNFKNVLKRNSYNFSLKLK